MKFNSKDWRLLILFLMGAFLASITSVFVYANFVSEQGSQFLDETLSEAMRERGYLVQEDLVVNSVRKANPAVVSILLKKDSEEIDEESFLNPFPYSGGSGFFVSDDGYILTNKHVVEVDEMKIFVYTFDGKEFEAKLVDSDPWLDISVLKVNSDQYSFPYLTFSDSELIKVGQTVMAIGNPMLEFENSLSLGVISGLSRTVIAEDVFGVSDKLSGVIQTDAAINPGNSGGPLLDLEGNVIGMNVALAEANDISFAIPSNYLSVVVKSVQEKGTIDRPFLGIRYLPVVEEIQSLNDLNSDSGVVVLEVFPDAKGNNEEYFEEGDVIVELDGIKVNQNVFLGNLLSGKEVGSEVNFKILRRGLEKELNIKLNGF